MTFLIWIARLVAWWRKEDVRIILQHAGSLEHIRIAGDAFERRESIDAIDTRPKANIYMSRAQLVIALEALDDAADRFVHMPVARDLRQNLRDSLEGLDRFDPPETAANGVGHD